MKVIKYYLKLKNGDESIYVDIYYNKYRRIRKKLDLRIIKGKDTETKLRNIRAEQIADSIIAKQLTEMQNKKYGFVPSYKTNTNFVEYFNQQRDLDHRKGSSWTNAYKKLVVFISFADIDSQWIESFQKFLLTKTYQNIAHQYMVNVRYCLNNAHRRKIIDSNPFLLIPNIKEISVKREFLTLYEIIIMDNSKCKLPEVKRAFMFSCLAGLKYSDIAKLKWKDIKEDHTTFFQKKVKGYGYLPLLKIAENIFSPARINKSDIISVNEKVFDLPSKELVYKTIKQWVKNAGINKDVSFQTARHTFVNLSKHNKLTPI